jgi:hypothetical protein
MVEPQVPQNDRVAAYQPGPLSAQSSCIWSGEYDAIREREREIMNILFFKKSLTPVYANVLGVPMI